MAVAAVRYEREHEGVDGKRTEAGYVGHCEIEEGKGDEPDHPHGEENTLAADMLAEFAEGEGADRGGQVRADEDD